MKRMGKEKKKAVSKKGKEELEKTRNADREIMELHRREQRLHEEKIISSMENNLKCYSHM